MKPWLAALLAFIVVGLVVEAVQPAAGGLSGLVAAAVAYFVQKRRLERSEPV